MKIIIVILHFGELKVTQDCIASLEAHETAYREIVVVNNGNYPLSKKDFASSHVTVINNKKNCGFAAGVNMGISHALKKNANADALLLLNNDTYITEPFMKSLTNIFLQYPKAGIVGPAICFKKDEKDIYDIGGYINWVTGRTHHREVRAVGQYLQQYPDYITGAAMMIKREVFQKVGKFDEHFFLYYEDADFCIRAREKGYSIVVDPSVSVYHLLSKSVGKVTPFAVYNQTKSLKKFGVKYINNPIQKFFHLLFMLYQTTIITLKHPFTGIAAWKAMLE